MTHCGDLRLFVRVKTSEKKKRSEIACVNLQSECREGSEFFGFFSLHNTPRALSLFLDRGPKTLSRRASIDRSARISVSVNAKRRRDPFGSLRAPPRFFFFFATPPSLDRSSSSNLASLTP